MTKLAKLTNLKELGQDGQVGQANFYRSKKLTSQPSIVSSVCKREMPEYDSLPPRGTIISGLMD